MPSLTRLIHGIITVRMSALQYPHIGGHNVTGIETQYLTGNQFPRRYADSLAVAPHKRIRCRHFLEGIHGLLRIEFLGKAD